MWVRAVRGARERLGILSKLAQEMLPIVEGAACGGTPSRDAVASARVVRDAVSRFFLRKRRPYGTQVRRSP